MNATDARDDLLARGYVPMSESPAEELRAKFAERGLVAGARVCNEGQRWYEARERGTAVVVAVYHKPNSSWAKTYGKADVEVLIERDSACQGGATCQDCSKFALWQDYCTHVAYGQSNPA